MKIELIAIAVIMLALLALVVSCQNRPKRFQESVDRWREHRQERRHLDPNPTPFDGEVEPNQDSRRRERRHIFPRSVMET